VGSFSTSALQATSSAISPPVHTVLGMASFGTRTDERTSFALLDRYVEERGVWVDTANCYAYWNDLSGRSGQSEAVLGRWLTARPGNRERIKIGTKVGAEPTHLTSGAGSTEGLSAEAIRAGIHDSLDRLATNHVDPDWAHKDDYDIDQRETVGEFGRLITEGLAYRWGYSNTVLWRVERARGISVAARTEPPTAIQLRYTYLQPRPMVHDHTHDHRFGWVTDEVLQYATHNADVELWAYMPLMSGAYDREDRPISEAFDHPGNTRRLAVLSKVANNLGISRTEVVTAWLAGGTLKVVPIVGVSTKMQVDTAVRASQLQLPTHIRRQLDEPW